MKKICTSLCLLFLSFNLFSQTCEEREQQFLGTIGGLGASYIYTTYVAIGSICDGYVTKLHTEQSATELLTEQDALLDNLQTIFQKLVDGNHLTNSSDKSFVNELTSILKGLGQQSRYFREYMKDKSTINKDQYESKRQSNWNKIAQLLDIEG